MNASPSWEDISWITMTNTNVPIQVAYARPQSYFRHDSISIPTVILERSAKMTQGNQTRQPKSRAICMMRPGLLDISRIQLFHVGKIVEGVSIPSIAGFIGGVRMGFFALDMTSTAQFAECLWECSNVPYIVSCYEGKWQDEISDCTDVSSKFYLYYLKGSSFFFCLLW